jgi:hypothetical protein
MFARISMDVQCTKYKKPDNKVTDYVFTECRILLLSDVFSYQRIPFPPQIYPWLLCLALIYIYSKTSSPITPLMTYVYASADSLLLHVYTWYRASGACINGKAEIKVR